MRQNDSLKNCLEKGIILFRSQISQKLMEIVLNKSGRGNDERLNGGQVLATIILNIELVLNVLFNQIEKLGQLVLHRDLRLLTLLFRDVLLNFRFENGLTLVDHVHLREALLHQDDANLALLCSRDGFIKFLDVDGVELLFD